MWAAVDGFKIVAYIFVAALHIMMQLVYNIYNPLLFSNSKKVSGCTLCPQMFRERSVLLLVGHRVEKH